MLEPLRDLTKDATSHLTAAGLITFSHESHLLSALAAVGASVLAVAWGYHAVKLHQERHQ